MSGNGCRMEEKTRTRALMFLPLTFQAGDTGKKLSWCSCATQAMSVLEELQALFAPLISAFV